MSEIDIISSDSLFSNETLEQLNQLSVYSDSPETLIEVRNGQYFVCSAFDPNANNLNIPTSNNTNSEINDEWKVCPMCKVRLQDLGFAMSECSQCGAEIAKHADEQDMKKSNGFTGIVMPNFTNCDAKIYVRGKIIKELKQKSFDSTKHKIPMDIIEDAVDQFLMISEHKTHRGPVQRALKAKLIQYKLIEKDLIKTSKVIAQIFGITDKQLSAADTLIREYVALGIIQIDRLNVDKTNIFVRNYIKHFNIDGKYADFIIEIINEADKKNVHLINGFKPSTKATGAFVLFLASFPELEIKKSDVIKESDLTPSTVNRYHNLLMDNIHLLERVYKRWDIKSPSKDQKKSIQKNIPTTFKLEPLPLSIDGLVLP